MLVVTGYASADHVMYLDTPRGAERTTRAVRTAWPRAGGCPSFISAAAARVGLTAAPVMWLGDDPLGGWLTSALKDQGLSTEGLAQISGSQSPVAMLTYDHNGACTCLYDPGAPGLEVLTDAQRKLIGRSTHLCVSVGPPQVIDDILKARSPEARLYWAMKDDAQSFPPQVRKTLSQTADVIFCNRAERAVLPLTSAIVVETRGMDGVRVTGDNVDELIKVSPVKCRDVTGAGDTFAGGFIAAEMSGAAPIDAAEAGIAAAAQLLAQRERTST